MIELVLLLAICCPTASVPGHASSAGGQGHHGLRAAGGKLVDATGREVRLTGANWPGFESDAFAPDGLGHRNWQDMLDQIRAAGFDTIRLPYSNQLFEPASAPKDIDYEKNPDLLGLQGLALMDRIVQGAARRGFRVILDRHRPTVAAQSELWYTTAVPEARWIADWTMLARHYRGTSTVIGADLHNEPHGPATWGDGNLATDWRLAAERAGNDILAVNPDWLIFVEGIETYGGDHYWWGGNLVGAARFPVRLTRPERLVYSVHDYGPGVSWQPWFQAKDFPYNLPLLWRDHWGYLQDHGVAPVFVGEFGGRSLGADAEGTWQRMLVGFLKLNRFSYTYWSWTPDFGTTGGILQENWTTVDRAKLNLLTAG